MDAQFMIEHGGAGTVLHYPYHVFTGAVEDDDATTVMIGKILEGAQTEASEEQVEPCLLDGILQWAMSAHCGDTLYVDGFDMWIVHRNGPVARPDVRTETRCDLVSMS